MKMRLFLIAAAGLAAAPSPAAETVVVRGDRVNLRAQPATTSEVLGQVNAGTPLTVRSLRDGWVEVAIPESFDVYAHKDFIQDGLVTASPLNIRAGPGINYSRVGSIPKGSRITPRGEFGEWIRMAPPETASVWVSTDLVAFETPKPVPPPPEEPAFVPASPVASPAAPPRSSPAILQGPTPAPGAGPAQRPMAAAAVPGLGDGGVPPSDLDLAPVARQGAAVVREGRIFSPVFSFRRPSRFQLLTGPLNDAKLACYLRGNRAQLTELQGRLLRIQGREYWVRGSDHPVVVVEQIMLLED